MTITFEAYTNLGSTFLVLEFEIPYSEDNFSKILGMPNTRNIKVVG